MANKVFAAVEITNPIPAPKPAFTEAPTERRLRMSSAIKAPSRGPTINPGKPKNIPIRAPTEAPRRPHFVASPHLAPIKVPMISIGNVKINPKNMIKTVHPESTPGIK